MSSPNSNNDLPKEPTLDENDNCPIVKGLNDMRENLQEGGPEVVIDYIIAYVHQLLPDVLNDQVSKNIATYHAWNKIYREQMRERLKIEKMLEERSSDFPL